MRRRTLFPVQVACLLFLVALFCLEGRHLTEIRPFILAQGQPNNMEHNPGSGRPEAEADSAGLSTENITRVIDAVFDPDFQQLPRLSCPKIADSRRYAWLQKEATDGIDKELAYFFAINLRENLHLLPRLLGSVVEVMRFLGPKRCALSIVEGNSKDGTFTVLQALRPQLEALEVTYYLRASDINPLDGERIPKLAQLRNLVLEPLYDEQSQRDYGGKAHGRWPWARPPATTENTTVVFLNDVAACPEDILELVHQRRVLDADMTCGLDWVYVGPEPTFYDVWIARGMTGDSFFYISPDGNWNGALKLFWNDDTAFEAYNAHRPFQVFSCWNGAAVFSAAPLLGHHPGRGGSNSVHRFEDNRPIRFRGPASGECFQGEPQLLCKDMWLHGHGRIAVVPAVNLEYSDDRGRQIKELKGYTHQYAPLDQEASAEEHAIEWRNEPPSRIKCMPSYNQQSVRPWDEQWDESLKP